jgi:hypothetical protein
VDDQLKDYTKLRKKVSETCRHAEKSGTDRDLVALHTDYYSKLADYKRTHENIKRFLRSDNSLDSLDVDEAGVGLSCSPVCDITNPTFCTTVLESDTEALGLGGCAEIRKEYNKDMKRLSVGDQ